MESTTKTIWSCLWVIKEINQLMEIIHRPLRMLWISLQTFLRTFFNRLRQPIHKLHSSRIKTKTNNKMDFHHSKRETVTKVIECRRMLSLERIHLKISYLRVQTFRTFHSQIIHRWGVSQPQLDHQTIFYRK